MKFLLQSFFVGLLVIAPSCKSPNPHTATTELLTATHSLQAVDQPFEAFPRCEIQADAPEFVSYVKAVLVRIAAANPATFRGFYAPDQFCLIVGDSQDALILSDARSGRIALFPPVLFLVDQGADADVAAVLSHELAHVILQHGEREPSAKELPSEVDERELSRRFRVRAVLLDRRQQLYQEIGREAKTDAMFDLSVWLATHIEEVVAELSPLAKSSEAAVLAGAREHAAALRERFSVLSAGSAADPNDDTRFIVATEKLIHSLATEIAKVEMVIARPLACDELMPCETIQKIGRLEAYQQKRVLPALRKIASLRLQTDDDPMQYGAYTSWAESQAKLVAEQFFVNAGFDPARLPMVEQAAAKILKGVSSNDCMARLASARNSLSINNTTHFSLNSGHCSGAGAEGLGERAQEVARTQDIRTFIENIPELAGQLSKLRTAYIPYQNRL